MYFWNLNVVIFEIHQVVTLCIPKKDHVTINNHWFLYIMKEILHKGRHRIQTKFDIFDWLYLTNKLNINLSVDQDIYCLDFQNVST